MMFGRYSDPYAKGEIGLIVASIYEAGEVANVIYYSGNKPLAIVPKSFFVVPPSEYARISSSQRNKRTTIFMVGDNVEFELVPGSNRIVQWIRKSPGILGVSLSEESNKFVTKTKAVIPPPDVKQNCFWAKEFGWIPFDPELLDDYGDVYPEVPMNVTISIDICFGKHNNARMFMLNDFKPTCTYELFSIESVSKKRDFLRFAPWEQMSDLGSDHDSAHATAEISMKSEDDLMELLDTEFFKDNGEEFPEIPMDGRVSSPLHSVPEFEDLGSDFAWDREHDLGSAHAETSMKSEEENARQPEPLQSANSLSADICGASGSTLKEHTENSQEIQRNCAKESWKYNDKDPYKGEIGLIVASIYEAGEVANVIYYSGNKPLAIVPKSFFVLTPNQAAHLTNSQRNKRTTIFMVGDNVEFELVPGSNRIVQWIRKCSGHAILDVSLSEEINKFVTKTKAVIPPPDVKQNCFWAKEFGWVPFDPELLDDYGDVYPEVPMNVTISIDICFGKHNNARMFMLNDFKPTCTYELLSIESVSKKRDFLRFAPWKQMSDLGSEYDSGSVSVERNLKSEEEISFQLKPSQSANSAAQVKNPEIVEADRQSTNENGTMPPNHEMTNTAERTELCEEPKINEKYSTSKTAKSKKVYTGEEMLNIKPMVSKMRLPFFFHDGKDAGCSMFPAEFNAAGDENQEKTGQTLGEGDRLMTWYLDGYRAGFENGFQKGLQLGNEQKDNFNVGITGR
ncbi:hypothetical protein Ddc_12180 [Ditylenchus destructor]|nr:hypothetical protein Ddc_12180 [Ditylenchus destructor]